MCISRLTGRGTMRIERDTHAHSRTNGGAQYIILLLLFINNNACSSLCSVYVWVRYTYIFIDIAKGCRPLSGASCTIYIHRPRYINVYMRSGYKHIFYIRREGSRGNRSAADERFYPPSPS